MKFLLLEHREAFYGGAAGGGKSDGLLMKCAMYLHVENYHSIVFRKDLARLKLEDGLIPRSEQLWTSLENDWGESPVLKRDGWTWHFPIQDASEDMFGDIPKKGGTVSFGFLNHPGDEFRYGSSQYQVICHDEVTEEREEQYRFLGTRNRRTMKLREQGVPLEVRSAANPVGPGVAWVKRRFSLPAGRPDRPFIPSRIDDNPYLDRAEYISGLKMFLDPVTLARMMDGNWEIADPGQMFKKFWVIPTNLVKSLPLIQARTPVEQMALEARNPWKAVRYWDTAATKARAGTNPDWTTGALMATRGKYYYMIHEVHMRGTPAEVVAVIKATAQKDVDRANMSTTVYIEQEPGGAGVYVARDYASHLAGFKYLPDKVTGPKEERAAPLSTAMQNGIVYCLPFAGRDATFDELEGFPGVEKKDRVDAWGGAFAMLSGKRKRGGYRSR